MERELLSKKFKEAGLRAVIGVPSMVTDTSIFSMTIANERRKGETFVVNPGATTNRVEVLDVDAKAHQLLLFVSEPRRKFVDVRQHWGRNVAKIPEGARLVKRDSKAIYLEMETSPAKRHLLMGLDERGLFASQLPRGCSSIRQAHEALRPQAVKPGTARQGEHFFTPCSPRACREIDQAISAHEMIVERKQPIRYTPALPARWSLGNPHVVDELVVIAENEVCVRGAVRHRQHATVEFRTWTRVTRNLEVIEPQRAGAVVGWVD